MTPDREVIWLRVWIALISTGALARLGDVMWLVALCNAASVGIGVYYTWITIREYHK